jgi:hypothetical protein
MFKTASLWISLLSLLVIISFVSLSREAQAAPPIEVGMKVPLAGFVSLPLGESVRLEASAVIPGFSAPLVDFEGALLIKLYPAMLTTTVGGLTVRPFVGGGVAMLQAVGEWVPGLVLLTGAETASPELPLTVFVEGSGTLLMGGSAPTLAIQISLGARLSLEGFLPNLP